MDIILKVTGEPVPRSESIGHRRLIDNRASQKKRIREEIREQYKGPLIAEALVMESLFFLGIPESASKQRKVRMLSGEEPPVKRPDCSNLLKLLEDVLTGIVYEDDRFIVQGSFQKQWALQGHTILRIRPVNTKEPAPRIQYVPI